MHANAKVIGLDIAKNVFVAVGLDRNGKVVWKRKLSRDQVLPVFRELEPKEIGIEACAGSHYWARELIALGHNVKLIAAQHTRAYVTGNKNDTNDAAAIAEAHSRSSTKNVAINTVGQQDLQMLLRARGALMKERTAMICRIRAFAGEYGMVFARGVAKFRDGLRAWLADSENGLSGSALETFRELKSQLDDKEERLHEYERRLNQAAKAEMAQKLMEVPGVGPITATAVMASVADARHFRSGRDFAANLGLVPREHSSGGKQRLYGITNKGDTQLRTLIIHGARSALRAAGDKPDRLLRWVMWALLAHDRSYVPVWSNSTTRPA